MPIPRRADHGRASTGWTALTLALFAIALAVPATAAAAPTANFSISPASPHQGQAVTYTSTGTCDVAPCTNRWYHPEEFATTVAQPRKVVSFTYLGTPGVRTVQLTVRNASGASASITRSFTLLAASADTTPPNTTVTSGPSNPTTSTSASLAFNSSETGSTFACRSDAGAYAACTAPKAYSAMAMGAHTFTVRATDAAGNVDASPATWSWTVNPPAADTTAPTTTITSAPGNGTSTSASASFTGADNVGVNRFECKLDAGSYATCTSPKAYTGLAVGSHTFSVRAFDAAGNVDASPATATWTISTQSGGGNNCMPVPSVCGFPDTTNTGVLPGVARDAVSGTVTLSTPGQVFENKTVTGAIVVKAPNVTIRNVKIIKTNAYWAIDTRTSQGSTGGLKIQDVEINMNGDVGGYGVICDNYVATRLFIHNGSDGTYLCDNAAVHDSFISLGPDTNNDGVADNNTFCHVILPGDTEVNHFDGMQSDGGNNEVYDHNTIRNPCSQTSAILISTNTSPISDVTITDNLMAGGGWTLYCGAAGRVVTGGEVVTGNRIAKTYWNGTNGETGSAGGGWYGPVAYCGGSNMTYSGNVWDETGTTVGQ